MALCHYNGYWIFFAFLFLHIKIGMFLHTFSIIQQGLYANSYVNMTSILNVLFKLAT